MNCKYAIKSGITCVVIFAFTSEAFADDSKHTLHITSQNAVAALTSLAKQTKYPLIFDYNQVRSLRVNTLNGNYTLQEALDLILKDSGFSGRLLNREVITISPRSYLGTQSKENKMIIKGNKRALASGASIAILSAMTAVPANAQTSSQPIQKDEIIVTATIGSRGKPRSALDSPVAIDSINADELIGTGATETGRILQELVPSFNFSSSSISDGTDSLRPATLRGLGPDQTLVLVNGKRRHKSALIHVNTSVGRGTAGTDINAIPSSALKNVEVLRDGAAALYGSDAIAGVINFVLKDSAEGGNISASVGQYYEGDGRSVNLNVNKGFALGEDGFVNITYEYNNRESTNRAGLSAQCQYLCTTNAAGDQVADPSTADLERAFERQNFRIGDSDSEAHTVFANLGYDLNDTSSLYAFGSWGSRQNESGGFYRRANQGSRTLLDLYPNGFLPLIRPEISDVSLNTGIDWEIGDKLTVDTSVGYGSNSYNFEIANSANVSLGLATPTVFDAGTLKLSELSANIDAVYDFDKYVLAFGGGYREETYELEAGEPASYANGGFINTDTIYVPTLFGPTSGSAGAQVFRGFSPSNQVDETRTSYAAYAEVSADLTDRINAQAAARYENYDGFGGTLTWKVAGLARVTDYLNVRGSIASGFRAPSMQQLYFNSTSTQFVQNGAGVTVAEERGTFRNDSSLAKALGIPDLQEETSLSWGLGAVLTPFDGFTLTVDYYKIDIDDRIMISGSVNPTPATAAAFAANAATSGQFFINGVDTKTSGVDIITAYKLPNQVMGGDVKLTASANFTSTSVKREIPAPGLLAGLDLVTDQDISILEEWQPKSRINLGANWSNDHWSFSLQGSQYGKYTICEGSSCSSRQTFGAKWLADVSADYRFENGVKLTVGANNLFDQTPDANLIGQSRGGRIVDTAGNLIVESDGVFQFSRRSAPFGFNGGYVYSRVSINF
ncbi:MAG: ligand-gated channel protein [Robiginitomaculum sp.]|nr:MAG: ligand-gated channel protein [Robiginitomaculum sp.]